MNAQEPTRYPEPDETREPAPAVPPAPPIAARRGPNPYIRVILYIVGYFVVGIALSMVGAFVGAILELAGVIKMPTVEAAMSIEEILEFLAPYLFPVVILAGLYTIAYTWAFMRLMDRRPHDAP